MHEKNEASILRHNEFFLREFCSKETQKLLRQANIVTPEGFAKLGSDERNVLVDSFIAKLKNKEKVIPKFHKAYSEYQAGIALAQQYLREEKNADYSLYVKDKFLNNIMATKYLLQLISIKTGFRSAA
ncbi:MAG: hypothetical protein NUV67_05530 [archaeon]|nr:hypothetical protein [archaeon]